MLQHSPPRHAIFLILGIVTSHTLTATAQTAVLPACRLKHGLDNTVTSATVAASVVPVGGVEGISAIAASDPFAVPSHFASYSPFTSSDVVWSSPLATPNPRFPNITSASAAVGNATVTTSAGDAASQATSSSLPSNCSSYLDAVMAYCTHLASGYGTILSPKLGLFNSSANMSDPWLHPFLFDMEYMPSTNCSNTVDGHGDGDFALAFTFAGKRGYTMCFDMFSFSECSTSSCTSTWRANEMLLTRRSQVRNAHHTFPATRNVDASMFRSR